MGIDAIIALIGLVVPPAFDFIKKKFIKQGKDSPEATMASLAVTKRKFYPDIPKRLANYYMHKLHFSIVM